MQENAQAGLKIYLRFVLKKRLKNCCNRENINHRFTRAGGSSVWRLAMLTRWQS
jgi:hypothetical protein